MSSKKPPSRIKKIGQVAAGMIAGALAFMVISFFLRAIKTEPPPMPAKPKAVTVEQALGSVEGWGVTQVATSEPPNLYFALPGRKINRVSRYALGEAMLQARATLGEGFSVNFSEETAEIKDKKKPYVRVICVRKWR